MFAHNPAHVLGNFFVGKNKGSPAVGAVIVQIQKFEQSRQLFGRVFAQRPYLSRCQQQQFVQSRDNLVAVVQIAVNHARKSVRNFCGLLATKTQRLQISADYVAAALNFYGNH